MSNKRFEVFLKAAMLTDETPTMEVTLEDLDTTPMLSAIDMPKQNNDIIRLPKSFRNNEAISRYYGNIGKPEHHNIDLDI